jgi:hypothetical protein
MEISEIVTLVHSFQKNPSYELHWIFIFLLPSGENSPPKKCCSLGCLFLSNSSCNQIPKP